MDDARRCLRSTGRTLRSATKTFGDAAVLGATAYAVGSALAERCPWCKKSLRKMINPPFCPNCRKNTRIWSDEQQEELEERLEERLKSIRASSKAEMKGEEEKIVQEIMERGPRAKKPKTRE